MATHLAAVAVAKSGPFELQTRPTPNPGPGELLVAVKAVALNPADHIMRDMGLFIPSYPAVIGFDLAGLVLEVGDEVPHNGPVPCFRPGVTRVAAYAAAVWKGCDPDYGAFQEQCLVPWQHAVPLPDEDISWAEAATLPVAVQVPLSAWDAMRIPRRVESSTQTSTAQHQGAKTEALLIWGASSSVGTMGVQSARLLRDDSGSHFAAVYATSSVSNHQYVRGLGADRVFDYKDPSVAEKIVSTAKTDGLVIRHCFLAMGELVPCQAVLQAFSSDNASAQIQKAHIAMAPPPPQDMQANPAMEIVHVQPSMTDEARRLRQFEYWMGTWLKEQLEKKTIKPSPEPTVVGKGCNAINAGLDMLKKGVSCTKLVIDLSEI